MTRGSNTHHYHLYKVLSSIYDYSVPKPKCHIGQSPLLGKCYILHPLTCHHNQSHHLCHPSHSPHSPFGPINQCHFHCHTQCQKSLLLLQLYCHWKWLAEEPLLGQLALLASQEMEFALVEVGWQVLLLPPPPHFVEEGGATACTGGLTIGVTFSTIWATKAASFPPYNSANRAVFNALLLNIVCIFLLMKANLKVLLSSFSTFFGIL